MIENFSVVKGLYNHQFLYVCQFVCSSLPLHHYLQHYPHLHFHQYPLQHLHYYPHQHLHYHPHHHPEYHPQHNPYQNPYHHSLQLLSFSACLSLLGFKFFHQIIRKHFDQYLFSIYLFFPFIFLQQIDVLDTSFDNNINLMRL